MVPHADKDELGDNVVRLPPPDRPPFSEQPPRLLIIGGGNRGRAYAKAIQESSNGILVGIVEPIAIKRNQLGRKYIWGKGKPSDGQSFEDWKDFIAWEIERRTKAATGADVPEAIDAVFVCVQDAMHKDVVLALAPLQLHIMCEKPLAPTLEDCTAILKSLSSDARIPPATLFSIGHVLRYSPHNMLLRKLLLEDKAVGEIMAVNHTEPVGWYHFTHSYVR